ncbi:replication protein A 70 kDa DNA-binding subunit B-like [Bidens hawaiensis]|uniref:replication protein A 70 kDa DNA-binding subunit B-like n=1 Tax=Bidens hawaiensis TaxID=980011 RepID=UPI00404ABE80
MEPKDLIKLRELDATKTNYTIKVRVVRLWRKPNNKNPNEIWSIEMIIMDEEGTKMQASVFKTYFPKFEEHLRENECYFIFRPTLADNDTKIKHVDNGQKISFRWQTDLKKCTTFKGSMHGFEFTNFGSILKDPLPQYTRLNIIGYVYKCYEVEKKPVRGGKEAIKMEIKLEDLESRHIILTLWEEYCQQMLNYMQNKQQAHVFLILQFGNLHIYGHNRTVSNVYDTTRLFINSPIDEILEFKKSFLSNIGEETSSHRSVGTSMVSSLEDEFLNDIDFINIREINEIKEVKSLIVVGKIKALCIEKSWNYRSCDLCKNGVETTTVRIDKGENPADFEVAKQYKCLNDNCTQTIVSSPMIRYKIPIRVQDCTWTVTLTMFEREANKLIGRIAKDVLDEQEQSAEFLTLPAAFNVLLERKFAFRIEIKNYNLDNNAEYFSITKLTEDLNIISKLENNFYNNQVEDSDSVNPSNSELPLQTDVSLKDSISCTADNGTPISNSNESVGTAASVDLKRNLEDVYDVDESSALSSTKQQKIHTKDLRDANWNETLLIPKTEK